MKDKIKKILGLKKQEEEPIFLNDKEELEYLRKENESLKESFIESGIEKFKNRRSIRKYADKKIDFKITHNIIEAGLNAPCAGNIQNYKIIILEDKDKMKECAKVSLQQYWMCDAPLFLVVIRDDEVMTNTYPDYGNLYAIQNTAALIENMVMAAHFYDLGACWVECGDNAVIKGILDIPQEKHVDAIIPIGYPQEQPKIDKLPTENFLFYNKWDEKNR